MSLKIVGSIEDRSGTGLGPDSFGYVYFNDGTRVGYSPGAEGHPVWEPRTDGGGKYKPVTTQHIQMAADLLYARGVLNEDDLERLKTGV